MSVFGGSRGKNGGVAKIGLAHSQASAAG